MAKLKEILAPKLKKIAKTQVFGKSACVHAPPDCEKKPEIITGCPNYLELNKLKKVDPINGFQMPCT